MRVPHFVKVLVDPERRFAMSEPPQRPLRADAQRNYASLVQAARVAVTERGPDISLEEVARSAGVAIGTLYNHFPTRQDLLEAVFLEETNELRLYAEELANSPDPLAALIQWLRLQMAFAGRGRSMGAAVMSAKHVPGTRIATANAAMHQAGEVLLQRAQATKQIRQDVTIRDVVRLVYGIVMVNEHAADPDSVNRMFDLIIAGISA
jgi:AcrR family transcriptional regulator